jgi:hypothetical protein
MKKVILLWITTAILLISTIGMVGVAGAQTIIPEPTTNDCAKFVNDESSAYTNSRAFVEAFLDKEKQPNLLGCAIKTGRLHLYMAPYFITYIIQFLLGLAGLISILFIVIGGFRYTIGGLTEDKESGKKTIMYAILGLVVSLSAWIAINFIQATLTQ